MTKFVLVVIALLMALVCLVIVADAQTAPKRRAVKTGTPNGILSPAIIAGDLVFTSGQIGIDPKTEQMAASRATHGSRSKSSPSLNRI